MTHHDLMQRWRDLRDRHLAAVAAWLERAGEAGEDLADLEGDPR